MKRGEELASSQMLRFSNCKVEKKSRSGPSGLATFPDQLRAIDK